MRSWQLEPPAEVPAAPVALGRLGAGVRALAAAQGRWPPDRPHTVPAPAELGGTVDDGADAADRLVDAGGQLVVVRGGADPRPALVSLAVLLDLEPVAAVGRRGGPDWAQLVQAVRSEVRRVRRSVADVPGLLEAARAEQVAALTGLVVQCAQRRTPVLLSAAPDAVAAAVAAQRLEPGSTGWVIAGCSAPPGAAAEALRRLGLDPLLDLQLPRPEGADLALHVLLAGVDLAHADQARQAGLAERPDQGADRAAPGA